MARKTRYASWNSRVRTWHGPLKLQTHQGTLAVGAGDALKLVEGIHHDARTALQAAEDAVPFRHIRLIRVVALLCTSCLRFLCAVPCVSSLVTCRMPLHCTVLPCSFTVEQRSRTIWQLLMAMARPPSGRSPLKGAGACKKCHAWVFCLATAGVVCLAMQ